MKNKLADNQTPEFFINGIIKGDMAILSRAITLVESQNEMQQELAQQILDGIIGRTGNSFRLGITGAPGVGKSTFIEFLGKEILKNGHKLAVLAIDPSSSKSKGSILGDKTRMTELSAQKDVYIRPSPAGGVLGGVTRSTYETILLCEAAGFDFIIIETVGVGQSEISVGELCDFFLLLMLAGAGDELQGIKKGIMEMADALVITKADGNNLEKAKMARAEFAHAMHFQNGTESGWTPRTLVCSAIENKGLSEIYKMIKEYLTFSHTNHYFLKKRKEQQIHLLFNALNEQLKKRFYADPGIAKKMTEAGNKKIIQPFSLAKRMVDEFLKK